MSRTRKSFSEVGLRCVSKAIKGFEVLEKDCADDLLKEIKSRCIMPPEYNRLPAYMYKYKNESEFEKYLSAWKIEEKRRGEYGEIIYIVSNDYSVFWKKLGKNIAFGHFVEWGVGTAGLEDGNPHNYDYTLTPWDSATKYQQSWGMETPYNRHNRIDNGMGCFQFGARAVPHIHPSVEAVQSKYFKMIKDKLL